MFRVYNMALLLSHRASNALPRQCRIHSTFPGLRTREQRAGEKQSMLSAHCQADGTPRQAWSAISCSHHGRRALAYRAGKAIRQDAGMSDPTDEHAKRPLAELSL